MQSVPIALDTVAVRVSRPGLYGVVVTRGIALLPHEPRPLRSASIEVLNEPHRATSGADGRFSIPQLAVGSHAIVIALDHYVTKIVPVTIPDGGGVAITATLDSPYREVAEHGGPGFIRGTHTAWRHGNYVFVGDEVFGNESATALFAGRPTRAYGRLHVVDVSDINNPKPVAWYEPEYGGVHNVWVAGDTLYVGAYNAGFKAVDISGELKGDLRAQGREIADYSTSDPKGFIPNAPMT
jgi:hypothetical protein